ncbi:MAG TPA: hypothetical protein VGA07_13650, partial [Anaerolineales bacterium]
KRPRCVWLAISASPSISETTPFDVEILANAHNPIRLIAVELISQYALPRYKKGIPYVNADKLEAVRHLVRG